MLQAAAGHRRVDCPASIEQALQHELDFLGFAVRFFRRNHRCPCQDRRGGVDSNLATAVRTTVVLVFTWGIALATSPAASLRQLSNRTLLFLTLSGIATGLSWLCYFRALQLGQVSRVAPVDKLSVVFAIVLAAVVLGEKLQWQHYVGGAFIVTGALILART